LKKILQSAKLIKKLSLAVIIIFYLLAGINHFRNPHVYYNIIPAYLRYPYLINIVSGVTEIIFGVLLIFKKTRKFAAYAIIIMLFAFIPAHLIMIEKGWCLANGFSFPLWAIWLRLFPLQFLLMWWAWWHRK
jgi:uncharacterized membrane protein